MDEKDKFFYDPIIFAKIMMAGEDLAAILNQDKGMRIGQSTVCSQKIHTFHPKKPQEVNVLQDIDAGQTFYHRKELRSISHLDIFHECGVVDHYAAAAAVRTAVELYNEYDSKYNVNDQDDKVDVDFFDIQTSTGGGRITGSLAYGKKLSLRKGHANHVHITMAIPQKHLACLFYVVMAVENAILACNLELRRNEKVENMQGSSKGKIDLSAYADLSDSLLQENNSSAVLDPYEKAQDAADMVNHSNISPELRDFSTTKNNKNNGQKPTGGVNSRQGAEGLAQRGIIDLSNNGGILTKSGKQGGSFLELYVPEIQIHLQQVIRNVKYFFVQTGKSEKMQNKIGCHNRQNMLNNLKVNDQFEEVNISESISAAARRMVATEGQFFKITHEDLRYAIHRKKHKIEFCLLLDASSSMEGQRIRVAKQLARFLFLRAADPMSVIVFQENSAWVQVPFTRDLQQLKDGLDNIKTKGETPLALGLTACIQYIEKNKVHNPLIILITDGVPTLGMITGDPVYEALKAAKQIKAKKYAFTCIGLKPHLDYLHELSKLAGGSIYAVEDLGKIGMY